ncbi:periplasmic heavy metal sensor [Thioclava sp. GXIMD4216]|uniref:periplasmic heavy metal sensor n=1 Tax=unclassified Thioclava TaxID=2621713 RepID=UPI0030CB8D9F
MNETRRKGDRKTRWALMISVTLNLLVAGVIIGGAFGPANRGPQPPQVGLGPFDRGLTDADRQTLTKMAKAEGFEFNNYPGAMDVWLDRILTAIEQTPYDEVAVRDALNAHRMHIVSRIQTGEDIMVKWLGTLTPEDRKTFVERIRTHEEEGGGPPPQH